MEVGLANWDETTDRWGGVGNYHYRIGVGAAVNIPLTQWENKPVSEQYTTNINIYLASEQIKALSEAKVGDVVVFTNIIFYSDQAKIKEESFPILDQIALFLKGNPDIIVELRGFTNAVNDPNQEQELSRARAEAVKAHMTNWGIESYRLVPIGYGSVFSKGDVIVEANRRVEIKIIAKK